MKDTVSIQQLPPDMRPREKILALGPASLTDTELLALLLRTGVAGKPVFGGSERRFFRKGVFAEGAGESPRVFFHRSRQGSLNFSVRT